MEHFRSVLLNVWQEACRHIEIGESAQRIAELLVDQVPVSRLLVRRFDPERKLLETVAAGGVPGGDSPGEGRTECSPEQVDRLLAWSRRGNVTPFGRETSDTQALDFLLPPGLEGDALGGPLRHEGEPTGLVILVAKPRAAFSDRDEALAAVLLEPLSVALDNDRRLREMQVLREAAEADRQSLLSRLGRKRLVDTIVGTETGLRAVMERVELVARSDVPVLIFGETGTGKELVARAIHSRSPREAGPIHRVNCGAIPSELIDSELFGHERGAFTGAVDTRKGWFERADGGTLFLDEIGELPPAAQVRLLRILQDGWLERVGGDRPIRVDVRIVAATHRDLAGMVAEGRFREDLWYRIAVFPIVLPTLRERQEDIAPMARHFARRAATRFGLPEVMPSEEDVRLLAAYPWPGNVRELAAVIDRAAILGDGRFLDVPAALGVGVGPSEAPPAERPGKTGLGPSSGLLPLDEAMRQHIEAALDRTGGRIEGPRGAAAILEINPHTLRARMRKLGIDWKRFRTS